tara:strand:+ start:119 stop:271 length:153 start_codon:yes stop_codon:yes gene_type:complete
MDEAILMLELKYLELGAANDAALLIGATPPYVDGQRREIREAIVTIEKYL